MPVIMPAAWLRALASAARSPASSAAAAVALLDGWALHGPVRAEHTAVARFRAEDGLAALAHIEPQAGIRGHRLVLHAAALGTRNRGPQDELRVFAAHALPHSTWSERLARTTPPDLSADLQACTASRRRHTIATTISARPPRGRAQGGHERSDQAGADKSGRRLRAVAPRVARSRLRGHVPPPRTLRPNWTWPVANPPPSSSTACGTSVTGAREEHRPPSIQPAACGLFCACR